MSKRPLMVVLVLSGIVAGALQIARADAGPVLFAGAAREDVTPFTRTGAEASFSNPDGLPCAEACTANPMKRFAHFEGTITRTGVWGEPYVDTNGNGRYDAGAGRGRGEPFTDDPNNAILDSDSAGKWDGIYLAGNGSDRVATGVLDPLSVRVAVFVSAPPESDLQEQGGALYPNVAVASGDFFGYYSDWTERILENARSIYPFAGGAGRFFIDRLIVSATHNHSAPDVHVGMWGPDSLTDGTYPLYERYVERKIALALVEAMMAADRQALAGNSVKIRAGAIRGDDAFTTVRGNRESLGGMQARAGCRTPWFFDDELRAFQAVDVKSGKTVLSMINWGTDNSSLGDRNTMVSSDFAGYARAELEARIGGVSIWMPGAQGAVEIVGDSCPGHWARHDFDGETFPKTATGVPFGLARTRAIGRLVGDAAFAALESGAYDADPVLGEIGARDLYVDVTNRSVGALAAAGVIDKPGYVAERASADAQANWATDNYADGPEVASPGADAHTTLYAFEIGPASFVTIPGDIFPELYADVETNNRMTTIAYDVIPRARYISCSASARRQGGIGSRHQGRPFEPGIREQQVGRFGLANVHFVLGFTPDTFGAVIPGYDYAIYGVPVASGAGLPLDRSAAPDDCAGVSILPLGSGTATYDRHAEETTSASSMLGPAVACTLDDLLHPEINWAGENDACDEWDQWRTATLHNPLYRSSSRLAFRDPERNRIRHY